MKKHFIISLTLALFVTLSVSTPVMAISNPDDTPVVDHIWIWRNVLETGDTFVMFLENTPYATTPTDYTYSQAFIWRLMDGDDDIGQAVGYSYDEDGYGYNVIGFYFDAADAPAWAGNYTLRLSGNPSAFADPPEYNFPIDAGSYSALTDTDDVQADIADKVIYLADELYTYWGLSASTSLIYQSETAIVLSIAGQSFFRGAIYGIQGMAPAAFPITIDGFTIDDRAWTGAYETALDAQHAGNPIETALNAGESLLDVDYNLFGLIIILVISGGIILANWYLAGGQVWKGLIEAAPILVIGTRMGLMGLGELGLVAAICMLYDNARLWKLV